MVEDSLAYIALRSCIRRALTKGIGLTEKSRRPLLGELYPLA